MPGESELPGMWEESDLAGGETDAYPTEWKIRDGYAREEWRQTSVNTYEVRNPEYIWQLNREGWDAYNEGAPAILEYLKNNFVPTKRRE